MKVLHIINAGYEGGGAEKYLVQLAKAQKQSGDEVAILSSDLKPNLKHFSNWEYRHIPNKGILKYFLHLININACLTLRRVIREYKPDIVHIHTISEASPTALFLLRKLPTVMTIHGPEEYLLQTLRWVLPPSCFKGGDYFKPLTLIGKLHYFYLAKLQAFIYKYSLKSINLFIAPSRFIAETATGQLRNIVQVYNGINLLNYSKPENSKAIMFAGSLKKIKGTSYLIQAMHEVILHHPKAKLYICGEGEEGEKLKLLVKELGLINHVKFLGWQSSTKLVAIYKKSDVVVIPSVCPENLPTVCIEAMGVGRPVIGSRVGGIGELVADGITGYLVEGANSSEIAKKITKIFDDRSAIQVMGKAAHKKANDLFDINEHVKRISGIYQSQMKS